MATANIADYLHNNRERDPDKIVIKDSDEKAEEEKKASQLPALELPQKGNSERSGYNTLRNDERSVLNSQRKQNPEDNKDDSDSPVEDEDEEEHKKEQLKKANDHQSKIQLEAINKLKQKSKWAKLASSKGKKPQSKGLSLLHDMFQNRHDSNSTPRNIFKNLVKKAVGGDPGLKHILEPLDKESIAQHRFFSNYKLAEEKLIIKYAERTAKYISGEESRNDKVMGEDNCFTKLNQKVTKWEEKNLNCCNKNLHFTLGILLLMFNLLIMALLTVITIDMNNLVKGETASIVMKIMIILSIFMMVFTTVAYFVFKLELIKIIFFEILSILAAVCYLWGLLSSNATDFWNFGMIGNFIILQIIVVFLIAFMDWAYRKVMSELYSKIMICLSLWFGVLVCLIALNDWNYQSSKN